jgi:glycosyltransferase involved in cell wall biosynthesis
MKVLYCNPSFWDYRLPFYNRLNELFKGEFYVIYSPKRYCGREKLLDKIKTVLGKNALPYENEPMFDVHTRSFNHFSEGYQQIPIPLGLLRKIHKVHPDVLVTEGFFQWTPLVVLYGLIFRTPVFIGYERTLHTERNSGKIRKWHRKFTDLFIRGYLVNGSETKKYLLSIGIKESKIHIGGMSADSQGLRNGIASLTIDEKKAMLTKYKRKDGIVFLFCGALIERKGVEPLLEAWQKYTLTHPNDTLLMVGGGILENKLKSEFGSIPTVFIEGRKEYSEVCKYYAIADVFILPTIEDNWSLVIPEAMSCGLPVATSIYNGCHTELIHKGENGITFDTFNQESIIQALNFFHGRDLKLMGEKSIEFEKPFDTEHCAQRTYQVIIKCKNRI